MTNKQLEILLIPSGVGHIVCTFKGFSSHAGRGRVDARLLDVDVTCYGYDKERTLMRTLAKLHQAIADRTN
ncbi:hypothetical protein [Bacillus fonticola]|uniref:hypothetical protein n=1 Tax=Bacillus fonticola TaxID=2728853 RepID=UPI0014734D01|nr:hypothetical protein [Bacillus fonticola]